MKKVLVKKIKLNKQNCEMKSKNRKIISFFIEKKKCKIVLKLTSIPSRFMMVASILRIAVLMDLGGGNLVMPIFIAFDLL